MAETVNIARVAEKLSKELFGNFGWQRVGPANTNSPCVDESHEKETHPTDVVFSYPDIYKERMLLINTDLKSYAKGTIQRPKIVSALQSLALATDCARKSAEWQARYVETERNWRVVGLLFIYNHDGDYDDDFAALRRGITSKELLIPKGVRLFLLGPSDIAYLATIRADTLILRGEGVLPGPGPYSGVFYPHLVTAKASQNRSPTLTLETLTAPWQVFRFTKGTGDTLTEECIAYIRSTGSTPDEFLYFFDYLFRFQILDEVSQVQIRMPFGDEAARANFNRAKAMYCSTLPGAEHVHAMLERVTLEIPSNIVKRYLFDELGMD